jgi:hypothetical protein
MNITSTSRLFNSIQVGTSKQHGTTTGTTALYLDIYFSLIIRSLFFLSNNDTYPS